MRGQWGGKPSSNFQTTTAPLPCEGRRARYAGGRSAHALHVNGC